MKPMLLLLFIPFFSIDARAENTIPSSSTLVSNDTTAYGTGAFAFDATTTAISRSLSIPCGSGAITIDLRTGQVETPKDVKLPDAAVAFWLRVAESFPDVRRAIVSGDPTPTTVDWIGKKDAHYELGFRSDGVVVWREKTAK